MTDKATKSEANYRAGSGRRRCQYCTMFVPPNDCTSVQRGPDGISPQAVCDYFEAEFQGK